jgi:hypothetical protein
MQLTRPGVWGVLPAPVVCGIQGDSRLPAGYDAARLPRIYPPGFGGLGNERIIMGNLAVAGELTDIEEISASEAGSEGAEPDTMPGEAQPDTMPGEIKPETMPGEL